MSGFLCFNHNGFWAIISGLNAIPCIISPMSGSLFAIAAPSGAGKTSLVKALLQRELQLMLSVSHTTRPAREGERDGRDYFFITAAEFARLQAQETFIETATVYGNLYGTSKEWLSAQLAAGRDVILEIDWQGAAQIKRKFPDTVTIYILPPSLAVLEARLRSRGLDAPDVIATRLQAAMDDMSHLPEFEYVIINQDFNVALLELTSIVETARHRTARVTERNPHLLKELVK
jgi:guanylate kinase